MGSNIFRLETGWFYPQILLRSQKLFQIQTPDQEKAVSDLIAGGIEFFSKTRLNNVVLETFESGKFALCAIEQTSPDMPDLYEVEKAFLVLVDDTWMLLPQPQYVRSEVNNLTKDELAIFELLKERFYDFKQRNAEKGNK